MNKKNLIFRLLACIPFCIILVFLGISIINNIRPEMIEEIKKLSIAVLSILFLAFSFVLFLVGITLIETVFQKEKEKEEAE